MRGGNRLARLPWLPVCSNCFASNRLCAANASSGDNSGGICPAICNLGSGVARLLGDGSPKAEGSKDLDLMSMKLGLVDIVMVNYGKHPTGIPP